MRIVAGWSGVTKDAGVVRQRGDGAYIGGTISGSSQPLQPAQWDEGVAIQQHDVASGRRLDAGVGGGREASRPVMAQQRDLPLPHQPIQDGGYSMVGRGIIDNEDLGRFRAGSQHAVEAAEHH